jgi:hypothetical protein
LEWWCMDFDTPRLLVHDPLAFTTAAEGWWLAWWSTSDGSYTSVATSTGKTGRCSWNSTQLTTCWSNCCSKWTGSLYNARQDEGNHFCSEFSFLG